MVENGPDPVVDKDKFTEEYLKAVMQRRHVPVKALILDQAVISGVGNWVADESLYHAKLHPEQYCNEFSDEEATRLYDSIRYVCQTACDLLADSDKFPSHWMFDHRWGKGKGAGTLPNGEKLAWITVGGRTSCYAPAVQKKTGHVAPGIKEDALDDGEADEQPKKGKGKKRKTEDAEEDDVKAKKAKTKKAKAQEPDEDEVSLDVRRSKGRARKSTAQTVDTDVEEAPRKKAKAREDVVKKHQVSKGKPVEKANGSDEAIDAGRRRSSRLSNIAT